MSYNDAIGRADNLTVDELIKVLTEYRDMYGNKQVRIQHQDVETTSSMDIEPYRDAVLLVPLEEEDDD